MRSILTLLLLLFGFAWLACRVEVPLFSALPASVLPAGEVEADRWVRTSDGWEKMSSWNRSARIPPWPPLHPAVVALFECLVSVTALVAFATGPKNGKPSAVSPTRLRPAPCFTPSRK